MWVPPMLELPPRLAWHAAWGLMEWVAATLTPHRHPHTPPVSNWSTVRIIFTRAQVGCVGVLWWTICDLVPFSPSPSAMPWSGESKIWIRLHLISWLESWLMTCVDQMVDDEKAARLITINRSSLLYFSLVSWTAFLGVIMNCTSHLYLWAARSVGAIRRHRCQVDAPERTRCDCS